jgi:hypothetical protein
MAMTVDEALSQPGALVAAWDTGSDGHEWLGIYAASEAGVKLLGFERMDPAGRERRISELKARGIPTGKTDGGEYVWAILHERDFVAWRMSGRLFTATRSRVQVGPSVLPAADITCVTSWLDPSDLGHRAVIAKRKGAPPVVLVEEHDPASEQDPTYDRINVLFDASWARSLARDLAAWLGVKYEDQLT